MGRGEGEGEGEGEYKGKGERKETGEWERGRGSGPKYEGAGRATIPSLGGQAGKTENVPVVQDMVAMFYTTYVMDCRSRAHTG